MHFRHDAIDFTPRQIHAQKNQRTKHRMAYAKDQLHAKRYSMRLRSCELTHNQVAHRIRISGESACQSVNQQPVFHNFNTDSTIDHRIQCTCCWCWNRNPFRTRHFWCDSIEIRTHEVTHTHIHSSQWQRVIRCWSIERDGIENTAQHIHSRLIAAVANDYVRKNRMQREENVTRTRNAMVLCVLAGRHRWRWPSDAA